MNLHRKKKKWEHGSHRSVKKGQGAKRTGVEKNVNLNKNYYKTENRPLGTHDLL